MKQSGFTKALIIGITLLALVLRVTQISSNPPAISWDEASIGYNAYTILTTGRDEHGTWFPLDTFAAFGDYKPPVPIYLTVPFVALLGLNELAVRLPSAIAGTLTVMMLYFLVLELFQQNSKYEYRSTKPALPAGRQIQTSTFRYSNIVSDFGFRIPDLPTIIALVSAALLAITPWHIMLSRGGFEANIALLFLVTGVWLVLMARTRPALWYVCWLPFVLGIYTFNSTRYVGPMIVVALLLLTRASFASAKKQFAGGVLLALVVLIPIAPHLVSREARLRFEEVSIFTDLRTVLTSNTRRKVDGFTWWSDILHNRRVGYAREYLIHFFDNLEPRFLFITGDGNPKFSIRDVGQLYLVSAPFIVIGLLALVRDHPSIAGFLAWWLIASIAPTAVARETPHALRIENGLPVYMILTAYGLVVNIAGIRQYSTRALLFLLYLLIFAGSFMYFWHNLMMHYPKEFSGEWQYGYKQAIEVANAHKDEYDTVVLTESIGRPYIYALFYEKTPLAQFLETRDASFDAAGFYNVYGFGKYRFTKKGVGEYEGRTLYILPPKDVPKAARVVETIRWLNGTPVLVAFE